MFGFKSKKDLEPCGNITDTKAGMPTEQAMLFASRVQEAVRTIGVINSLLARPKIEFNRDIHLQL